MDREVINFRTAGVVLLIIRGFPETVGGCAGFTEGGRYFYRFTNRFNIVRSNLRCWFSRLVGVPVFLDNCKEVLEVLDRFSTVVSSFITFPMN